MAITTNNGKYSMTFWAVPFQANVPIDSTAFATTVQKQMLIWEQGENSVAAPPVSTVIAQTRMAYRFVFGRVFGRVN